MDIVIPVAAAAAAFKFVLKATVVALSA